VTASYFWVFLRCGFLMQVFKGKSGGILAGLTAGALWGLVFVAPRMVLGAGGKSSAGGFSSVDLAAGRFLSYGLVAALLMFIGLRHKKLPNLNQAFAALVLSLLGFTGYYLLLVFAINDAGTEMPTLIIGTIPIWVMFLGKPQGLSFRSLLPGLLLTAVGLVLMGYVELHGQPETQSLVSLNYWRGIAFAMASMVCWTIFAIANSAWLKKHPEVSAADWANWLGVATGLGAWLLWLFAGSDVKTMTGDPKFASFAPICIATGLGSAWLATIFWNIASQRLSASLCGQLIVSETVFALIYSSWWDGQLPAVLAMVAGVMFVLGILASIKAHR
jgi:drug/metabolite transporter (DMT)-like permease